MEERKIKAFFRCKTDIVDLLFLRFKSDVKNSPFVKIITFPLYGEWGRFLKCNKSELKKLLREWERRGYIKRIPYHGIRILV